MSITADQEKRALTNVNTQLFIGGEGREASGGATLDVEDPSTREPIARGARATPGAASAPPPPPTPPPPPPPPPAPFRAGGPRTRRASAARSCAAPTRRSPPRPT